MTSSAVTTAAVDALQVQGASRRIGARTLLDRVDLHVSKGAILGLVGPNGAGKTSLLRAISGRLRLDAGRIAIDGLAPPDARRKGRLGVVPQEIALYEALTVRENLEVLGRLAGVPARDVRARVDTALAWAGLTDRAQALVPTLSGGMRRRVNLVASTLHDPAVLLLDEPTVGVDADARGRLHDLLRALRDRGVALLIATHDLDEAARLCDHVAVVSGGAVVARDTVPALISRTTGGRREVTVTLADEPDAAARAVLEADGFRAAGDRQWIRTGLESLADAAAIEPRLGSVGLEPIEVRVSAPGLAGAIATLTRLPGAPAA